MKPRAALGLSAPLIFLILLHCLCGWLAPHQLALLSLASSIFPSFLVPLHTYTFSLLPIHAHFCLCSYFFSDYFSCCPRKTVAASALSSHPVHILLKPLFAGSLTSSTNWRTWDSFIRLGWPACNGLLSPRVWSMHTLRSPPLHCISSVTCSASFSTNTRS